MSGVLLSGARGWNMLPVLYSQADIHFKRKMTLSLFTLRKWKLTGPSWVEDAGFTLVLKWFFNFFKLTVINVCNRSAYASERTQRDVIVDLKTELKTGETDSETSDVKIIKIQGSSNLSNQSGQSWSLWLERAAEGFFPELFWSSFPFRLGG